MRVPVQAPEGVAIADAHQDKQTFVRVAVQIQRPPGLMLNAVWVLDYINKGPTQCAVQLQSIKGPGIWGVPAFP